MLMLDKIYKIKYFKYKNKYLNLKNQLGGLIQTETLNNIKNAGMINFDDTEIEDLKNGNLLDSNIFLRNNKYFS
jgi:hypothetical protein